VEAAGIEPASRNARLASVYKSEFEVRAIAHIMAGQEPHYRWVLAERYLAAAL